MGLGVELSKVRDSLRGLGTKKRYRETERLRVADRAIERQTGTENKNPT